MYVACVCVRVCDGACACAELTGERRFRESQKQAELAYVHATSVEVDLERVRKYRQFVCSSLCRSYLFSSLYGEQLEAIAASIDDVRVRVRSCVCGRACCVLTHACFQKERVYHKNEVVFRQGDLEPSFFLIYKGSIRLEKTNPGTPRGLFL
jgi:hypothetical protein